MTEAELRDQLEPLLTRHPFVPIRVDGSAGPILFVDNPHRADLHGGKLTILHKDEGRRPVAEVTAERVTRVTPVDELPPEPGCMSYRDFYARATPLRRTKPFFPFAVELVDGTRYISEEQGQIGFGGRLGVYDAPAGGSVLFWVANVSRVYVLQPAEVA